MDFDDDPEDFGPTAAKRMRVAEITIENVKAEVAVETEQHAQVSITPDVDTADKLVTEDLMENEGGQSESGRISKKKKKPKQENESGVKPTVSDMLLFCQAPGCGQKFASVVDHDIHYNTRHRHVCSQCKKPFATPHLLELHVLEHHDTFFAILAERKPMYSCLDEACTLKFKNSEERLEHCVAEHQFSKTFRLGGKPKAFKQDSRNVIDKDKVVHSHTENSNKESSQGSPDSSKTLSNTTKKPKPGVMKETNPVVAHHISFGRSSVRFIPRQVFAMPKKQLKSKPNKTPSDDSTQQMTDLNDLQDALQATCSSNVTEMASVKSARVDTGHANNDGAEAGMEL